MQEPSRRHNRTHDLSTASLTQGLRFLALASVLLLPVLAAAQRTASTAERHAEFQVGAGLDYTTPDYTMDHWKGLTAYATLDFRSHLGVEFVFHQANSHDGSQLYERTYELGPRYVLHYGRLKPFARATYGRGVFNYPNSYANLAYNMVGGAGGVDIHVLRHVNVRAEYEVVRWLDFPDHGLQPTNVTVGAAYRF